ncbi:hypothetical protein DRQ09_07115 [candidate division KSB1 bacterium]|nr:MAG: hypothetical protein DRQ09_07115 [candidate division KSB1 bacterium]
MKKLVSGIGIISFLFILLYSSVIAQEKTSPKAELPVLITSCGQSPGPVRLKVFMKRLKFPFDYNLHATAADLVKKKEAGTPYKTLIIVTGASLKGMGAAGVSIKDELSRINKLIEEAKKQKITIIGAHIEGMARRAQGAAPGDNTDELSIDAVCPRSDILLIRKDGNADGRFTTISKGKKIPMILFEKNLEIPKVLKSLFEK